VIRIKEVIGDDKGVIGDDKGVKDCLPRSSLILIRTDQV